MKIIGYITVTILLLAIMMPLNGYMISVLWDWFIIPLFKLPSLSVPQAIGLAIMVSVLTRQIDNTKSEKSYEERIVESVFTGLTKVCLYLSLGFVVKGFL